MDAETVTDTRVLGFRNVQDSILEYLGKMGDEIDALPQHEEVKGRAQNLQGIIQEIRRIVISFGERFTG